MYFEVHTNNGEFVYINSEQICAIEPVDSAVLTSDGSKYVLEHSSYDDLVKNLGIV